MRSTHIDAPLLAAASALALSLAVVAGGCKDGRADLADAWEAPRDPDRVPQRGAVPGTLPRPGCDANFERFDGDGDDRLTREEFLSSPHAHPDPEAIFDRRDADDDGALSRGELCAGWPSDGRGMHRGRGGMMGPGGRGPGPHRGPRGMGMAPGGGPPPHRGRGGMGMAPGGGARGTGRMASGADLASGETGARPGCAVRFDGLDADGDGAVTEAEFLAGDHARPRPNAVFARRDDDGDGQLSRLEFCRTRR